MRHHRSIGNGTRSTFFYVFWGSNPRPLALRTEAPSTRPRRRSLKQKDNTRLIMKVNIASSTWHTVHEGPWEPAKWNQSTIVLFMVLSLATFRSLVEAIRLAPEPHTGSRMQDEAIWTIFLQMNRNCRGEPSLSTTFVFINALYQCHQTTKHNYTCHSLFKDKFQTGKWYIHT